MINVCIKLDCLFVQILYIRVPQKALIFYPIWPPKSHVTLLSRKQNCKLLSTRAATVQVFFGSVRFSFLLSVFGYFGSVQTTV